MNKPIHLYPTDYFYRSSSAPPKGMGGNKSSSRSCFSQFYRALVFPSLAKESNLLACKTTGDLAVSRSVLILGNRNCFARAKKAGLPHGSFEAEIAICCERTSFSSPSKPQKPASSGYTRLRGLSRLVFRLALQRSCISRSFSMDR